MKSIVVVLAAAALFVAAPAAQGQEFVVVVNASNPVSELSRSEVSNTFLKKASRLVAVDLDRSSAVREAFSRSIHGRSASAVLAFWQQQIFAGRNVPPAERSTDADVLSFVRNNTDAIGYVAAGTALGNGVKAVQLK